MGTTPSRYGRGGKSWGPHLAALGSSWGGARNPESREAPAVPSSPHVWTCVPSHPRSPSKRTEPAVREVRLDLGRGASFALEGTRQTPPPFTQSLWQEFRESARVGGVQGGRNWISLLQSCSWLQFTPTGKSVLEPLLPIIPLLWPGRKYPGAGAGCGWATEEGGDEKGEWPTPRPQPNHNTNNPRVTRGE